MHRQGECGIHFRPSISNTGIIIAQDLIILRLHTDDREQVVAEDVAVHASGDKRLKGLRFVGRQQFHIFHSFLTVFLRPLDVVIANSHHIGQHRLINSRQSRVSGVGRPFLFDKVVDGHRYGIG